MTFRAVPDHHPESREYSAMYSEALRERASVDDTDEEARATIREAIELYLAPGDLELSDNATLVEVTVG